MKREISELHFDAMNKFSAIKCGEQTITAKHVVFGNNFNPGESVFDGCREESDAKASECGRLSRAIYITDKPIGDESINAGGGGVIFMKLPSQVDGHDGAYVIQLAHFSGTTPKGLCKLEH